MSRWVWARYGALVRGQVGELIVIDHILADGFVLGMYREAIPPSYQTFSQLEFAHAGGGMAEMVQEDSEVPDQPMRQREDRPLAEESVTGHYLSDDDIEEW